VTRTPYMTVSTREWLLLPFGAGKQYTVLRDGIVWRTIWNSLSDAVQFINRMEGDAGNAEVQIVRLVPGRHA